MRLAVLLLLSTIAQAAVESELVTQGVAAFQAAEFDQCVDVLGRALAESLTRDEKVVAYRTLAFCHSALDHANEARAAFVQLLRVDEKTELERSVAPKVRVLFEEARAAIATGEAAPEQSNEPVLPSLHPDLTPPRGNEGHAVTVSVSYPGGSAQELQIFYRSRGQVRYQTQKTGAQSDGRFDLVVPGSDVKAPALELYLTALDGHGAAVARAGNFAEPLVLEVAAPPVKKPKRLWVWGVVAGALMAAGLAVGLGVGLTSAANSRSPADVTIIAPSH
jgi:hypothetical protein